MSYLQELNPQQLQAVKYIDGPSLIIAGAGSGKTRVLTYKIIYLIENGYKPENILALTFTNKAADEMKQRIAKLIPLYYVKKIWMGTFHSVFAKILRIEAQILGYSHNFTIFDTEDSKKEIDDIIKHLNLPTENYKADKIFSRISNLKNNLYTPETYINTPELTQYDKIHGIPDFHRIFTIYQSRLKKYDAMDFDDLLLNTNILFRDYPDILRKYQDIFKFILVDEYQDTNYAQYVIIKKLASRDKKISVVGDDSQSIYSFRGARIENILHFHKDFPQLKIFKLERNYRSTKNIVNAANSLIEKNTKKIPKTIYTQNSQGEKIYVVEVPKDIDESYFVAKKIKQLTQTQNYSYGDFAIMYRTNAQSRLFEKAFRQNNIPYKIFGSISFYQRKEIKDILAYLRMAINPYDNQAFKRIINVPKRGIGKTTIDKLTKIAMQNNASLWEVLTKIDKYTSLFQANTLKKLNDFREMIELFREEAPKMNAYQFVDFVQNKSGLKTYYEQEKFENPERLENLQEFLNDVSQFIQENNNAKIDEFIQTIALRTSEDKENPSDTKFVSIMTIHAAKGLEFKTVFIVGVEEGFIPLMSALFSSADIEEERRLFYVAITRAKEKLYILYTRERMKWGKIQKSTPSRFLDEIDKKYLTEISPYDPFDFENNYINDNFVPKTNINPPEKNKFIKIQNKETNTSEQKYSENKEYGISVGMKVKHKKFGIGTVIALEDTGANAKAEVDFIHFGKKKLLLKFAKLTQIK